MPPNKSQSNYSKRPVKKVRLLKIRPRTTKSLIEEYFYGFVVIISVALIILLKAGGMSGYDAVVAGLWVGGFTWFARMAWRYRKEKQSAVKSGKSKQAGQATSEVIARPLSPNFKPMIGPQWPLRTPTGIAPTVRPPGPPGKRPMFVYERPTLPDRKPKFPANWPGQQNKKPKP
jgi:hypothetical protein